VTTIAQVVACLPVAVTQTVKAVVVDGVDGQPVLLLVRGDHTLNEIKAEKLPQVKIPLSFASPETILQAFGCLPGSLGPVGFKGLVIADHTVAAMSDMVCGANMPDVHLTGVNWGRDCPEPLTADIRNVVAGDPSPDGQGELALCRGIEVGHIFQLRTKYASAMNCTYLDANGKTQVMEMGCYGIGVSRIVGACIEQNHDERGIIFPLAMAPFSVVIVPLGMKRSEAVRTVAEALYAQLQAAGIDVLLDDRDERPGVLLADAELMGIPYRVVIGERGLQEGHVEWQGRRDSQAQKIAVADIAAQVQQQLAVVA
jgi:prolyl-tRNA synthetase